MINIYKIENSINNKLYIGQTKQKLGRKFTDHKLKAKRKDYRTIFHEEMFKLGIENFKIVLIETVDKNKADERERYWIKKLNTLVPNGYNSEYGGKKDQVLSKITRQRMSISRRKSDKIFQVPVKKYNQNFEFVSEYKSKTECTEIEKINIPSKSNLTYIIRNNNYYTFDNFDIEEVKKLEKEKEQTLIYSFDKKGKLLKIYQTTLEMENDTGKFNTTISMILRKKQLKFNDGTFCLYKKDVNKENILERVNYINPKKRKKIIRYNDIKTETFINSIEAAKATGLNRQMIGRACKAKKFYKGYYWDYCE